MKTMKKVVVTIKSDASLEEINMFNNSLLDYLIKGFVIEERIISPFLIIIILNN